MAFRQRKNTAAIPRTAPAFEHIVTEASDSFLWRLDDYPWERNVWNFHPEYESICCGNPPAWSWSAITSASSGRAT
ncbi:hypothetical protein ACVILI_001167 [Mesorhizobium sp. USDA 4775]